MVHILQYILLVNSAAFWIEFQMPPSFPISVGSIKKKDGTFNYDR